MNLKMHVEEDLDPAKTYVLGVHPHSALPWGAVPTASATPPIASIIDLPARAAPLAEF
jgi:hypothetical protein